MTRSARLAGTVLAGLFLGLHLPFLPASLEDLDSINFALGIRAYDVAQHQPHPPGYPVFMAVAKLLHVAGLSEVLALGLLSAVSGSLAVLALVALYSRLDLDRRDSALTWLAALVTAANPLFWLTSARPLSDLTGLAAAIAVQALTLSAREARGLALACAAAAFASGIRSQVVWLTVPLLVLTLIRLPAAERFRGALTGGAAFVAGGLIWFVPMVVVSGGPSAYLNALFAQGAEDLTGVTMLATTPTVRQMVRALQYALLAPWGYWQAGTAVVALALAGVVQMWRSNRTSLRTLLAAFGPYLVFDLLFQETITTRYALPLVIPASYLAVRGLALASETPAIVLAVALAGYCATVNDGALARFSQAEAPVFRMLGDWTATATAAGSGFRAPRILMHRREEFDTRRALQWHGDQMPQLESHPFPAAKHEWLDVVRYWNGGGTAPVWFVADPLRSDLALIHVSRRPTLYRWGFEPAILLGGSRPSELDWHVLESPDWYLGEGWSLTPETAGIAREDGRGPGVAPIEGWIRRSRGPLTVMIGGRNLTESGAVARMTVELDGTTIDESSVGPGFFLKALRVPSLTGGSGYGTLRISSDNRDLAIEQFDAQPAGQVMSGFGDGWYEQEYVPSTGVAWRWTSERAVLRVRAEGHAVSLTLRGEIEAASRSHVVVLAGTRVVAEFDVDETFQRTIVIPADAVAGEETSVTLTTSASYVPAETRWRSHDRRRLGLKLYECRVAAAS